MNSWTIVISTRRRKGAEVREGFRRSRQSVGCGDALELAGREAAGLATLRRPLDAAPSVSESPDRGVIYCAFELASRLRGDYVWHARMHASQQ